MLSVIALTFFFPLVAICNLAVTSVLYWIKGNRSLRATLLYKKNPACNILWKKQLDTRYSPFWTSKTQIFPFFHGFWCHCQSTHQGVSGNVSPAGCCISSCRLLRHCISQRGKYPVASFTCCMVGSLYVGNNWFKTIVQSTCHTYPHPYLPWVYLMYNLVGSCPDDAYQNALVWSLLCTLERQVLF